MTFYGTIERVEVRDAVVILRCVRAFYHTDGLMADDVWLWTVSGATPTSSVQSLLGRSICGFEVDQSGLKIWLDEGDESATIAGSAVVKLEEPRSAGDLEGVIKELSLRIQQHEHDHHTLTRKIRDVATSIYQNIDRLERRSAFEAQRGSESLNRFSREIEDLKAIVRRLEERDQAPR
jgi:hypothetical protein